MTGDDLHRAFLGLERYAEKCVAQGGIRPTMDSEWLGRTKSVARFHNIWARKQGFPQLAPEPQTRRNLIPWARRIAMNGRDETWLAAALCHIDVTRSLEAWAEDVFEPLDPWWPQNSGPRFVKVPAAAWDLVRERQVNQKWMLEPMADLLFLGMSPSEKKRKNPLETDHEDTVRRLPGLLVARWIASNFMSHRYSVDLQRKVDLIVERSRADAADLDLWDDEVRQ